MVIFAYKIQIYSSTFLLIMFEAGCGFYLLSPISIQLPILLFSSSNFRLGDGKIFVFLAQLSFISETSKFFLEVKESGRERKGRYSSPVCHLYLRVVFAFGVDDGTSRL